MLLCTSQTQIRVSLSPSTIDQVVTCLHTLVQGYTPMGSLCHSRRAGHHDQQSRYVYKKWSQAGASCLLVPCVVIVHTHGSTPTVPTCIAVRSAYSWCANSLIHGRSMKLNLAGLTLAHMAGIQVRPRWPDFFALTEDTSVNYIAAFHKPAWQRESNRWWHSPETGAAPHLKVFECGLLAAHCTVQRDGDTVRKLRSQDFVLFHFFFSYLIFSFFLQHSRAANKVRRYLTSNARCYSQPLVLGYVIREMTSDLKVWEYRICTANYYIYYMLII